MQRERPRAPVVLGRGGARLDGDRRGPGETESSAGGHARGRERAVHVAAPERPLRQNVGRKVFVQERRALDRRLLRIRQRRQRFDVDFDQSERVFRDIPALGDDGRDRFADVTQLAEGERRYVRRLVALHARGRPIGLDEPGDVLARVDRGDARHRRRRRRIDRYDAGMGVVAAAKRDMQHAVAFDVGDEVARAREQPRILLARHARADVPGPDERCVAGHSEPLLSAAARMARTMCSYPVQRQMFPEIPSRISSSAARGYLRNRSVAVISMPGVQNPHWSA